jgi:LytS/YehU family sensor histidine kinase
MGIGEALTEEIIYDPIRGVPLNFNFIDYKIPTILDMPMVEPVLLEVWRGVGEYGACGMSEGTLTCTPRAIANAVYNAIGAMQYVAGMRGQDDIERAAGALSDLMRSVLGNRDEWITLWEERTYIESYIVLERMKVQNGFTLTWEVEESLWGLRIPKLMLQPLVENAVIHGITLKENGEIKIQGRREKGRIALRVIDNGVGMDEKQVAQVMVLKQAAPTAFRSVGVPNVMERVNLCYKGAASIEIYSTPGSFTCVEILLPGDAMEEDAYAGTSGAGG